MAKECIQSYLVAHWSRESDPRDESLPGLESTYGARMEDVWINFRYFLSDTLHNAINKGD